MRHARLVLALGAFFVSAVVLAACGGVPGNSVATVGDQQITRSQFEHWLGVAARGNAAGMGQDVAVPYPPDYTKCVARLRKAQPAKGSPKPSTQKLKAQCAAQYAQYRDQTMNFLIQAAWVQGEAADQGIKVSDAQVRKDFERQRKQTFPNEADYRKFLKQSGMTQDDIDFRVRVDTLANKLRAKATKRAGKVSQAEVAAYYKKNRDQFATPEQRTLRLVLTRTRARAEAARRALESGESWKAVAKRYSVDARTKNAGGLLPAVTKGTEDRALESAAFSAKKDALVGPVKAAFGWYVLQVEKIVPKKQDTLAQVQSSIRQQLVAQGQDRALRAYIRDFRKKWTDQTDCREGFKVEGCKDFTPPKKSRTGTVPGQPAPQQPQQNPGG